MYYKAQYVPFEYETLDNIFIFALYRLGKNLHIPLLVENNYGETIIVDDVYNSLSVNGFMVNGWLYSMEIPRGGMAAMDLELAASSLEEMQLNDPENIENIEFKLRIETARKK